MPTHITAPCRIAAAGNQAKFMDECIAVCVPAFAPETVRRNA